MTKEAQRIAIAEAVPGWRVADESGMSGLVHWMQDGVRMLSDPLDDLNAMQAAALLQSEDFWVNFPWVLEKVIRKDRAYSLKTADFLKATANQWAEAFILAKGLWVESP